MFAPEAERAQSLLDGLACGSISRRRFLELLGGAGLAATLAPAAVEAALLAGDNQRERRRRLRASYDYIIVGAGAAGCIIAAELAKAGADVLLLEAGGDDQLPEVQTPGIWFTNIGTSRLALCRSALP